MRLKTIRRSELVTFAFFGLGLVVGCNSSSTTSSNDHLDSSLPDGALLQPDTKIVTPGPEVGLDVPRDTAPQPGPDVGIDTPAPSGPEVGVDAPITTGPEVGIDAPITTGPEVGIDAPITTGPEVGKDAPITPGPEVNPDTTLPPGPEVGKDTPPSTCTENAACNLANGNPGLCKSGACAACTGASDDAVCASAYGAGALCINQKCQSGLCRDSKACKDGKLCDTTTNTCAVCATDAKCQADTTYGSGTICVNRQCVSGSCHDSTDCTGNKLCDPATHLCGACGTDAKCQNDNIYGTNTICLDNGQCISGTCHDSTDCLGKKICAAANHMCVKCAADTDCQADTAYGASSICVASQCVSGICADSSTCGAGRLCTAQRCAPCATNTQCQTDLNYGPTTVCVAGQCVAGACTTSKDCKNGRICNTTAHTCVACDTDAKCTSDTAYGSATLCLAGACLTGNCHDISSDCPAQQICGASVAHTCGGCATDAQCVADPRYKAGYLCVQNKCIKGDCHATSADCTGTKEGLICNATTDLCSACTGDTQCKNDTKYSTPATLKPLCYTTTGATNSGKCVANTCGTNNQACAANAADFCCGNKCVPGNCCADTDCKNNPKFGPTFTCKQNSCTGCDAVAGNAYTVDPVNGDDVKGNGSGASGAVANPACSFKTVTAALNALPDNPVAGTTITIVGSATGPVSLFTTRPAGSSANTETLPLQVPANVTITTKTGPIKLALSINASGFELLGDKATLAPATGATLTIDGGTNHSSGPGVIIDPPTGTATISNLVILNTGSDGIQVTSGTATIGAGVDVSHAGTTTNARNGLNIQDATVNITVPAASPVTSFHDNTHFGIALGGAGVLNINGVPGTSGSGTGTVLAKANSQGDVLFAQVPATGTPLSTITGLVCWGSQPGDGLTIWGGSKIKVRGSYFQANQGNGVVITSAGAGALANSLANIDLGTVGSVGSNVFGLAVDPGANGAAGLCVDLGNNGTTQPLTAIGNIFAGRDCTIANPGLLTTGTACTGKIDLGVTPGTIVTVDATGCTHP